MGRFPLRGPKRISNESLIMANPGGEAEAESWARKLLTGKPDASDELPT